MSKRRVRVEGKSYVVTYARLLQVARQGLRQAQEMERGSFHNLVSSIVFSAFSIEAYMNHVGEQLYHSKWSDRWSTRRKLDFILQELDLAPSFLERPFCSFDVMFRFRNLIAHGRTEELAINEEILLGTEQALVLGPMTEWDLICTQDNAQRLLADAEAMIVAIHERTGLDIPALGFLGITGSSITPL